MAMVDLSIHGSEAPVRLAQVAKRQDITVAYLEQIFAKLKAAGLVVSVRGPGGGYLLSMPADEMPVADIILAVNEDIKMTRCNHQADKGCMSDKARCLTHDLWDGLSGQIYGYLRSTKLADVRDRKIAKPPMFDDTYEQTVTCKN